MSPAIAAPSSGARTKSHSWTIASVPAKTPTPIERAGLTEVPVSGIASEVEHRERQADRERAERDVDLVARVGDGEDDPHEDGGHQQLEQQGGPPGEAGALVAEEVLAHVALGDEALEAVAEAEEHGAGEQGAEQLRGHVDADLAPRQAPAQDGAERHGRVEVTAGDATHGVGHHQHGETEGQGRGDEVAAAVDGSAAAEEDEHEGAQNLCGELLPGGRCVFDGVAHRGSLQSQGGRTPRRPREA